MGVALFFGGACGLDNPSIFFRKNDWSVSGKELFQALNASGLLLMFSDLNSQQAGLLLESAEYPVVILSGEIMGWPATIAENGPCFLSDFFPRPGAGPKSDRVKNGIGAVSGSWVFRN
ncbi:MAG: hypothetical protein R6V02_12685 [Candidatus Aminicenantes bacterium]